MKNLYDQDKHSGKFDVTLFVFWVLFLLFLIIGTYISVTQRKSSVKAQELSQSMCQYANDDPSDGCDNSDPCDPANRVKGGDGRCLDKAIQEPTPVIEQPAVNNVTECSCGK